MASANATVSAAIRSVAHGLNWARTTAATAASRIHPVASSTAAAEIVMAPSRVRVMFNSIIMRPRMGMAVIDKAVPRNRAKPKGETGPSLSG